MHSISFWRDYFQRMYVPHIQRLLEVLEQRVMPAFSSIDSEATAVQQRTLAALEARPAYSDSEDSYELGEAAFSAGLDYFNEMEAVRQTLLNSFAPVLYHVWEQQLLSFHRRQILHPAEASEPTLLSVQCVTARLNASGRDITTLECWPVLNELKLAANTVKHAEGSAAKRLHRSRPDLFQIPDEGLSIPSSRRPLGFSPLSGEHLYLKLEDLQKYGQAANAFWTQFSDLLED